VGERLAVVSSREEGTGVGTRSAGEGGDPTTRTGYIDPHALRELWFHTGTACNLACPFCLEGSRPGDDRLQKPTLEDVRPLIDEAVALGVEAFSFTGGEPLVAREFIDILRYAADRRPCLVLTNGTRPLLRRAAELDGLAAVRHPISFRVSIDHPDRARHDAGRSDGTFDEAWQALRLLHGRGFGISIARQAVRGEDADAVEGAYRELLRGHGLPDTTPLVGFPDFLVPGASPAVPAVTEDCMTRHQDEASRRQFMCAFSKMVVKQGGRMRVYACTLVDDDPSYDQGGTLAEAMGARVLLHHHRCYSCFAHGASCSELPGPAMDEG
jgi:sulfatase maturation enzyme AslB (radical SAM superfamily)